MGNAFKKTDMVHTLSISKGTLHRQRKDFNLEISNSLSTIDNDTLDGIVPSIKRSSLTVAIEWFGFGVI